MEKEMEKEKEKNKDDERYDSKEKYRDDKTEYNRKKFGNIYHSKHPYFINKNGYPITFAP